MAWKGLLPRTVSDAGITEQDGHVEIPYYRPDGTLFRKRIVTSDRRLWAQGEGTLPYGLERLPNALTASRSMLVICEGESDTLALREAIVAPDVFVIGSPGAAAWRLEWEVYAEPFWLVAVLGDGDDAGRMFVDRTRRMISRAVGWTMNDGEDVRSMLQQGGPDELNHELAETRRLQIVIDEYFPATVEPSPLGE